MMMVDTELRPSSIHGVGTFLLEPVKKGQLLWRFDSRVDRVYSEEELVSLPKLTERFLRIYSTWSEATQLWVLCGDNGRHFNHSTNPNTTSTKIAFGEDIAAEDLAIGEELTSDYAAICDVFRMSAAHF